MNVKRLWNSSYNERRAALPGRPDNRRDDSDYEECYQKSQKDPDNDGGLIPDVWRLLDHLLVRIRKNKLSFF